jgi:TetR/AcrR family transcriptional regulator, transcriptional repressor for nem operon
MEFIRGALDGETPGQRLDNFLTTALDVHMARGFVGGCLWGNTALEMSDAEGREPYVEAVRDVFDAWSGLLEEVIAAAQSLGQVRADIPADVLARQMVATIEGGIMLSRVQHAPGPMRECLDGLRTMLELRKTSHPKRPTPAATSDEDSPNPLNQEPGSERP